jgi:hypothetical protein
MHFSDLHLSLMIEPFIEMNAQPSDVWEIGAKSLAPWLMNAAALSSPPNTLERVCPPMHLCGLASSNCMEGFRRPSIQNL